MNKHLPFFTLFVLVAGGIALATMRILQSEPMFFAHTAKDEADVSPQLNYTVSAGDSWGKIADSLGISPETGMALLEASKKSHSLEDLHAGNALAQVFGGCHGFSLLGFRLDQTEKTVSNS